MARSSRPNDDNLFSGVLLASRVLEGVGDLSLEVFLWVVTSQPRVREREGNERKDLLGEFGNTPRSGSESQSKDNVGRTENTFGLSSIGENSGQVDDPRS